MNQRLASTQPAQPRDEEEERRRREEAAKNAARMPNAAQWIADYKRVFGPDVKVRWVREGDVEMGRKAWLEEI